jgi:hypothetical protein
VAERALLGVLVGALNVSEYTDEVDVLRWDKQSRKENGWDDMCQLLSGLLVCNNFRKGTGVSSQSFAENAEFFQAIFEIGRRYKIMNPEKMRSTYGKMMCVFVGRSF